MVKKAGPSLFILLFIDLDKFKEQEDNAIQERETKEIPVGERTGDSKKVDSEIRVESNKEDTTQEKEFEEKILKTLKKWNYSERLKKAPTMTP